MTTLDDHLDDAAPVFEPTPDRPPDRWNKKPRNGLGWCRDRCVACGRPPTATGQDPCIPDLPGVRFACCGHGWDGGYIATADGRRFVIKGARGPGWERYLIWVASEQGRMVAAMTTLDYRQLGWTRLPWGRSRCYRCQLVGAECRCRRKRMVEDDWSGSGIDRPA
jgi:hypothetical protein